jgi:hypothetical protein
MTIFAAVDDSFDEEFIMGYYQEEKDAIARVEKEREKFEPDEVDFYFNLKRDTINVRRIDVK